MPKLSGILTVPGGKPALGAVAELHNASGDVVDQVRVDDSGAFTYHLVAGEWRLNCWDAEGHRATRSVSLGDDDERVEVELH